MNYKKLLNRLENDTCIADLELYLSGGKKFDRRIITPKQKQELLDKVIPRLIKKIHNEIEQEVKDWYNAPIFKLAYVHCFNNRIDLSKIFDVSMEIVNRINKDSDDIAITQRYKEYYKRTINTEIL